MVVAELFDAVISLVEPDHRSEFADRLEVDHPRQSFDPRCFERGALVPGEVWGFDTRSLDRGPRPSSPGPTAVALPSGSTRTGR